MVMRLGNDTQGDRAWSPTTDESDGGVPQSLKLRQTEHEFLKRMFDVEDV